MSKKIAKYKLPHKEEDLDTLANSVYTYCSPHITGAAPDWPDIPLTVWTAFRTALAAWTPAYEACKVPHLPGQTEAKNLARTALQDALTDLLDRGLLLPPRTAADAVSMGFPLIDDTPTSVEEIRDTVDIDSITNGIIPGSHLHVIHYHILGSAHRAKAPYQMAVFQVHYRNQGEDEPDLNAGHGWGRDHLSMNEPFELHHEPEHAGKTAYYRARWQTHAGLQGPWAMASALVP
jgi:hypothetical protein